MIARLLNIAELLNKPVSVFLLGPRACGKSTLVNDLLAKKDEKLVFDLLLYDNYYRYLTNPSLIRAEVEEKLNRIKLLKLYVLIDEIQKIPTLLDEVHWLIEKYKNKISFILTGSSARKLKRKGTNLLAGRAIILHLYPFTSFELTDQFNLNKVLQYGSIPMVWVEQNTELQELILRSYVDTYLKEEIKQEALSRNIETFARFLELAAQMNGEPLNFSKLGRDCNTSSNTIKEYYQILYDTMLAFPIEGWHRSTRKQINKSPKVYFFDCGVINTLKRELHTEITFTSKRSGKLFESFIMQEIYRINSYFRLDYSMHYWRTNHGSEVDLILQKTAYHPPIAIGIKLSDIVKEQDLTSLKKFKEEEPSAKLLCFCRTSNPYSIGDVKILPWQEGISYIKDYEKLTKL